jgi:Putative Ig domain
MTFRRPSLSSTVFLVVMSLTGCGGGGGGGAPPPPPSAPLSYPSPQVYVLATPIAPLTPTTTESLSGFSSVPVLPLGLALNTATGVISGTPTLTIPSGEYKISAGTSGGTTVSTTLTITVSAVAANVISYGASALTFTAGIPARTLTPQTAGGTSTGWSISPQLPAGLAFDTANGAITGTPSAALPPTLYTVKAQNAAGPLSGQLTIEVDTNVLLDLGHNTEIVTVQFNGSTLLSEDQSGHWVLWNYATSAMIASGTGCTFNGVGPTPCVRGPYAAMAGSTAVIRVDNGFEVRSAATGAVIATISVPLDSASEDSGGAWWLLATDGSYIAAGTTQGLSVWSSSGQLLFARSGNYSAANAFASPSALRLAVGPAGANVLETIALPSGTDTISPSFSGQFTSWFADGSAFFGTVGTTVLVYTDAVVQEAVLNNPASPVYGVGPWLWSFSATSMNIYALASPTTPVASYPCVGSAVTSASTVAVFSTASSDAFCVIDLSGATPAEANYTSPVPSGGYAAASASQFVLAAGYGVLIDGASLSGTPRYFGYGQALTIAGNANQIAVATAIGKILYFNAVTLAQEGTIQYFTSQLALSPDGSILAAVPLSVFDLPASQTLNIYSLPSGSLSYSWTPAATGVDISLSGSGPGTVLGQVLSSTVTVSSPTGGAPIFSTTAQVLQISPDGTLFATSSSANPTDINIDFTGFGTNLWQNNALVTAVSGWPAGWIDNSHLLVNTYQQDYINTQQGDYTGCAIYGPTGMSAGSCYLPDVLSFQTVTSDTVYALNLNAIVPVSTGAVSWTSGDAVTSSYLSGPPPLAFMDTLAGSHVVFVSGSQVVAQSY